MVKFGIYEKALLSSDFENSLKFAKSVGYDFWEIAIDDNRKERLYWEDKEIDEFNQLCKRTSMPVFNMVLSLHRDYPLGALDSSIRKIALEYLHRAIDLAANIGIRTIQLAGYYSKKDEIPGTIDLYIESLKSGAAYASSNGILLGIENMDYDLTEITEIMKVIKKVDNPYLKLFLDVGNFVANDFNPIQQLKEGRTNLVGVHLKETKLGIYRRVKFGEGIVNFKEIFKYLNDNKYDGYLGVEMWNDDNPNSLHKIEDSINWLKKQF